MRTAHFSDGGVFLQRPPLDRDLPEGTWDQWQRPPRRNMTPGSQTISDIIQTHTPSLHEHNNWHTPVKTLPYPKRHL